MNIYVFSASNCAFFPVRMIDSYKAAGWDLSDVIEVSDDIYREFNTPKAGKTMGASDGLPVWIDAARPSDEQNIADAEQKKARLLAEAVTEIEWRKYAVSKGIATAEEADELDVWEVYRVLLMRIDTSKAPDIGWPTPPVQR